MLTFEPEKLRSVYVYIVKVTQEYVYVTAHRNGEVFAPKGSKPMTHRGHDVNRVRIHPTVFQAYKKYNASTEFHTPRLAALNYYGSTIVSMEVQMYSRALKGFQKAENWQSYFSRSVQSLDRTVPESGAYINGVDIFWFEESPASIKLSNTDAFELIQCKAIKLGSLGRPRMTKENLFNQNLSENTEDEEALKKLNDSLSVVPRDGVVLAYTPEPGVTAYSSVLAEIQGFKSNHNDSREEREGKRMVRAIYNMASESSPSQCNMRFLVKSANTIGELYGMEETEFLNTPEVVMATGHPCLMDIPRDTQTRTPIGRSAIEGISWLLGFMYRETNLDKLRELVRTMRYCFNNGLMPIEEDTGLRKDASAEDLPLVRYKGNGKATGLPKTLDLAQVLEVSDLSG